jgi:hypothetical protein
MTMEQVGNDLVVQVTRTLKGLMANDLGRDMRYKDEKEKEDFIKEYFKTANENLKVNNYNINIVNESLLIITANYTIREYVRTVAGETYFNYHLNKLFTSSYIDIKTRKLPIEYDRNFTSETFYRIKIPQGKKLDYYPQDKEYKGANFNFAFKNTASSSMLEANQRIEMNLADLILKKSEFNSFNEMLGQLNKQYNETIIIK